MASGGDMKMDVRRLSALGPSQLRKAGLEALSKALGPIGMVRFLHLFETGVGDYTKERKKWLSGVSVQDITKEVKEKRKRK
jgi:hypothetical protein